MLCPVRIEADHVQADDEAGARSQVREALAIKHRERRLESAAVAVLTALAETWRSRPANRPLLAGPGREEREG